MMKLKKFTHLLIWNLLKIIGIMKNIFFCEFLIDHLLRNYPSFFNFEVFIQAKDLSINKAKIYDIITKSSASKQTEPVLTTLK